MIRVLLIIAAAIVLIPAALIVIIIVASAVFGICTIFMPSFNSYDEINECPGCQGWKTNYCPGCRYNPEYWDGMKYKGPSRRELRRIRKESR